MMRRVVARFAETVCPPAVRSDQRTERVIDELRLMLGVVRPGARRVLSAAFLALDQGARLYPAARGRRFARLEDPVAEAYLSALLARGDGLAVLVQRLVSLVVMCYYALPDVQAGIGYQPDPYIAAVARRRMESYGAEIRVAEARD